MIQLALIKVKIFKMTEQLIFNNCELFTKICGFLDKNQIKEMCEEFSGKLCYNHLYPKTELLDWVDIRKLNWSGLAINPAAEDLLEMNLHELDTFGWLSLCKHSKSRRLINIMYNKYPNKICWELLSCNPTAIHILEANQDKICWGWLSRNPAAIHLLRQNFKNICWYQLCINPNPEVMSLLKEYPGNNYWHVLSSNPVAIQLLKTNQDKINWNSLAGNQSPEAMELLKANPDKINWNALAENPEAFKHFDFEANLVSNNRSFWFNLSLNPAGIHLLEQNKEQIYWLNLSENPAIFKHWTKS